MHSGKGITRDMGISLRSTHIGMPRQGLHCANVTSAAHGDDLAVEVDVFGSQPTGFDNTQPRAVHQRRNQLVRLRQQRDDLGCFTVRQHCRDTGRALRPHGVTDIAQRPIKHLAVKKHQSVKCLILRGSGHMPTDGQLGKKPANFRWPHLQRVTDPVVAQEIAYPVPVGLPGANAVVIHPNNVTKLFSQAWLGWCGIHIASMLYFCTVLLVAQKEQVARVQVVCNSKTITNFFIQRIYVLNRPGEVLL